MDISEVTDGNLTPNAHSYQGSTSVFDKRKAAILAELHSDGPDLSPKGQPDDEILQLLTLLNSHADFVSTSSCSGRAVVFLDANKTASDEQNARGHWLMSRHTPVDDDIENLALEQLHSILFGDIKAADDPTPAEIPSRLVTLKFEPLILHVLCRNISAASMLLRIATASGYRESGISISAVATPQEKILVAIRTTAIRLDIPLGAYDEQLRRLNLFGLGVEYLRSLLKFVNVRFRENESRKDSLFKTLRHSFHPTISQRPAETKEERRTRKREEGIKLQKRKNQMQTANYDQNQNINALDNYLGRDSLDAV